MPLLLRCFINPPRYITAFRVSVLAFTVSVLVCVYWSYSPLLLSSSSSVEHAISVNKKPVVYSVGVTMGQFIGSRAGASERLGLKMVDAELIEGFRDGVTQSSKLTDVEIQALLADYDKAVQWLSSTATASAKHSLTAQEELHLKDVGYAIGVSKGAFLQLQLVSYRQLGFEFDASELIAGFKDGLNHDLALSQTEVTDLLVEFDVWVKSREQERAAVTARQRTAAGEIFIDQFSHKVGVVTTPDGVSYQVLSPVADTGGKPTMGDTVIVDYHGRLIDGNEFVSGAKTQLKLAEVIPGLADGLQQMNIGSTVRVVIPAALGFGDVSTELVPSHSVLIFDVTLLSIVPDNNKGCNSSTCLGD